MNNYIIENLANDSKIEFSQLTPPLDAVVIAHCWQSGLAVTRDILQSKGFSPIAIAIKLGLPVVVGACSVSCGDWCALIGEEK